MRAVGRLTDPLARGSGGGGEVVGPLLHEGAAALEQVAATVGGLDPVTVDVRQGQLADLPRRLGTLGQPSQLTVGLRGLHGQHENGGHEVGCGDGDHGTRVVADAVAVERHEEGGGGAEDEGKGHGGAADGA